MKEIFQKKIHSIVDEIMTIETSEEFETYTSVLSVVYSLIQDDRLEKLDMVLRFNFPDYYNSPIPLNLSDN